MRYHSMHSQLTRYISVTELTTDIRYQRLWRFKLLDTTFLQQSTH